MTGASLFRCLVFHAERLEHDTVWVETQRLLGRLARVGARSTLFVHPFSAIERGIDLAPRLKTLIDDGHEIGQHTHFYAPRDPDPDAKPVTDLEPSNVRRCLTRDLAYLQDAGVSPVGFSSGGWVSLPEISGWLEEHGFLYDTTRRSFELKYTNEPAAAGGGARRAGILGTVVNLPTTASVRTGLESALLRRKGSLEAPGFRYELAYVHDYDLLSRRRRGAVEALMLAWRSGPWRSAEELARYVRNGAP